MNKKYHITQIWLKMCKFSVNLWLRLKENQRGVLQGKKKKTAPQRMRGGMYVVICGHQSPCEIHH